MVADRHRLAANHNKHCWRAFRRYQHRWPWTTLLNKLSLNIDKTCYSAFSNNPPNCNDYSQIDLKFNSANIKMCESVKYLGVWIDDTLNWKVHIDYIYSKLTKFVGIFFINLVTSSPLIVWKCCTLVLYILIYYMVLKFMPTHIHHILNKSLSNRRDCKTAPCSL